MSERELEQSSGTFRNVRPNSDPLLLPPFPSPLREPSEVFDSPFPSGTFGSVRPNTSEGTRRLFQFSLRHSY